MKGRKKAAVMDHVSSVAWFMLVAIDDVLLPGVFCLDYLRTSRAF
jgi:hypothetical protein